MMLRMSRAERARYLGEAVPDLMKLMTRIANLEALDMLARAQRAKRHRARSRRKAR